jgi:hypothetical protein
VAGETHFLRLIDDAKHEPYLGVAFAVRSGMAVGKYF